MRKKLELLREKLMKYRTAIWIMLLIFVFVNFTLTFMPDIYIKYIDSDLYLVIRIIIGACILVEIGAILFLFVAAKITKNEDLIIKDNDVFIYSSDVERNLAYPWQADYFEDEEKQSIKNIEDLTNAIIKTRYVSVEEDIGRITALNLSDLKHLESVYGIEKFESLEKLVLGSDKIKDFTSVGRLKNLKSLTVQCTHMWGLDFLLELKELVLLQLIDGKRFEDDAVIKKIGDVVVKIS